MRDKSIALDQIDCHIPLATITDKVSREMADEPIVNWEAGMLDGQLKIVICFVEFVPEEQIRLTTCIISNIVPS